MQRSLVKNSASDRASLLVIESVIMSVLVVGSLIYVVHLGNIGGDPVAKPRENLRAVAEDAFAILQERRACLEYNEGDERLACWHTYGPSMLSRYVTEALHGEPDRLNNKLQALLPPGARFNLYLDNGHGVIPIRDLDVSVGETVSVVHTLSPLWNLAYVVPDFSCYDPQVALNATVLPVIGSSLVLGAPPVTALNFSNWHEPELEPSHLPHAFTGYVGPADLAGENGYPAEDEGRVMSGFTYNTIRLAGRAAYDADALTCPLGASTFAAARDGLNASRIEVGDKSSGTFQAERDFTFGDEVTVQYDFTGYLASVTHGATYTVDVVAYDPVPPILGETAYRERYRESFTTATGEATIPIGDDALYGPVLVTAELTTDVTGDVTEPLTASLTDYFLVNFPDRTPAFTPTYQLLMEVWFPEWG